MSEELRALFGAGDLEGVVRKILESVTGRTESAAIEEGVRNWKGGDAPAAVRSLTRAVQDLRDRIEKLTRTDESYADLQKLQYELRLLRCAIHRLNSGWAAVATNAETVEHTIRRIGAAFDRLAREGVSSDPVVLAESWLGPREPTGSKGKLTVLRRSLPELVADGGIQIYCTGAGVSERLNTALREEGLITEWFGESYLPVLVHLTDLAPELRELDVFHPDRAATLSAEFTLSTAFEVLGGEGKREAGAIAGLFLVRAGELTDEACSRALLEELAREEIPSPARERVPELIGVFLEWLEDSGHLSGGRSMAKFVRAMRPAWMKRTADKPVPGVNPQTRIGRNDPCPCGSGKKFKKCCAE